MSLRGLRPPWQTVVSDLEAASPGSTYAYDPTYDPTDGADTGNGPSGLIYNTKTVTDLGALAIGPVSGSGPARAPMRFSLQPAAGTAADQFYLYVSHAKSGTTTSDAARRNDEAQECAAMPPPWVPPRTSSMPATSILPPPRKPATRRLIAPGVGQALDTADPAGNWTATSAFKSLLTESSSNLEYRDDFQFVTAPMISGSGGLQLVPGSYTPFGNNGTTALGSSVNLGSNTALNNLTTPTPSTALAR